MALLNIGNEDPGIRLAAYNLLYSLSITFRFDMANQLLNTQDLCIPANSTDFLIDISERLAASEPQLTLDFLDECLVGFHKSNEAVRQLCLDYASPWLQNLAIFIRHTPDDHNKNLSKTKDLIRLMIKLTVSHPNVSGQKKVG
jgi:neurofibromin 1